MQRQEIDFNGRLNRDDALPSKGDYTDARNTIKSTSLTGGGNSIKKIPSITVLNSLGASGQYVVAATTDEQDRIFYIKHINGNDAAIEYIQGNGSPTTLVTYEHGSPTIDPDIVVLGDVVVWNYRKEGNYDGVVLSWKIDRTPATIADANVYQIHFAKPIPVALSVTAETTGGAQNEFRDKKWDFAAQYIYDSGEESALSDFLTVFPEEDKNSTHFGLDGIGSVTLTVGGSHPTYSKNINYFGRVNDGPWRRITTVPVGSPSVTFKGVLNEALETQVASKIFDSVPLSASAIEVIKNRVFLGNIQDDLGGDPTTATVTVTPDSSSDDVDNNAAGGDLDNPLSYLTVASGTDAVSEGIVDTVAAGGIERDRLANASTYQIGFQFHDYQGRTRGVEAFSDLTTGMFTYPMRAKQVGISIPTAEIPSWAKYFQLVISNNRTKDFFVEGYGTGKGYEIFNADGSTRIANFAASADNVDSIVISTLIKYTFQQGDLININLSPMSNAREYKTLRVKGFADGLLYIEVPDDLDEDFFMSSEYLHFEIFSPAELSEDAIFRGTGDIRPISDLVDDAGTSTYTSTNPTGMNDCFFMKQKISPKTNIANTQWTTMGWKKQGTADEVTVYSNNSTLDLGFTNRFSVIEENADRATVALSGGNGINLIPPTVFEGSTEDEIDAYTLSAILSGTAIYADTGADIEVTGLTLTSGAVVGVFDLDWNINIQEPSGGWASNSIFFEIRVGSTFAGATKVTEIEVFRQGGSNTTNVSGNMQINITSGDKVYFAIIDDANSNSVSIAHSSSMTAVPTTEALSDTNSRAGDYLVHARLNLLANYNIGIGGAPLFTAKVAVDGTPTYTIVENEPLDGSRRSYDALFDHAASGEEKLSIEVTMTDGGVTASSHSLIIGNGTCLSACLKEDRELYNVAIEENGDPLYYLIRKTSKVDSVVEWRKPAGKPSLLYQDNTILSQSNKFRWGDRYVTGAKRNPISSFYFSDQAETGIEGGPITALVRTTNMREQGTVMLAVCERETSSIYIDERVISNPNGTSQLVASDDVVGSIQTLKGSFGSTHKKSITSHSSRVVFWDNSEKDWVRYSTEGLVPLGQTYKMRKEFTSKDAEGKSFYDPFHDAFFLGFAGEDKMYVFQDRFGFVSELDIPAEAGTNVFHGGVTIDNNAIIFRGNSSYKTSGSGFLSYFGSAASSAYVKLPVVTATPIEPLALTIKSRQWPLVTDFTSQANFIKATVFSVVVTNENNQSSTIPSAYFRMDSGMVYGDVYKDENSGGSNPLVNGLDLNGAYHNVQLNLLDNTIDDQVEYIILDYQILSGR